MPLVSTTETASYPNNLISRKLKIDLDQQLRGLITLSWHLKEIRVWIEKKILVSVSSILAIGMAVAGSALSCGREKIL